MDVLVWWLERWPLIFVLFSVAPLILCFIQFLLVSLFLLLLPVVLVLLTYGLRIVLFLEAWLN